MGDVIDASHLFKREPEPEEAGTEFWEWGEIYVNGDILQLQQIVEDMTTATTEAEFKAACRELVEEVSNFPDLDQ